MVQNNVDQDVRVQVFAIFCDLISHCRTFPSYQLLSKFSLKDLYHCILLEKK